jgi:hypothetical protein
MKNTEQLIGRKVRGFRFKNNKKIHYIDELMMNCVGKVGVITKYNEYLDAFIVDFNGEKWGYPVDQIEAHLVDEETDHPKFPKVWAWDDDVNQAFETYLIAELEGMEDGCNYLCVRPGDLNRFENKQWFRTDSYKHIAHTPLLNDIITVVEKYGKDFVIKTVEKL